jgi:hypothetical protein
MVEKPVGIRPDYYRERFLGRHGVAGGSDCILGVLRHGFDGLHFE